MGSSTSPYFVHPQGLCETTSVGPNTRIWAFAHVLKGAVLGRDCNVCDGVFIEADVVVGDETTIKNGVQLWDGVRLGNRVFVGPNATFTNDRFPRSKQHLPAYPKTTVKDGASIGANATITPGITIGEAAMIGAGAVVLDDVPARAIVAGNPGRVVGYANAESVELDGLPEHFLARAIGSKVKVDDRGRLTATEFLDLPFMPQRLFTLDRVAANRARGGHAHRDCSQIICASAGTVRCALDDGETAYQIVLQDPSTAIFVPPGVWVLLFGFADNAVVTVLASHPYSSADYINDYSEFLRSKMSGAEKSGLE